MSVAALTGQWAFGGVELVSVDQQEEGWVWSHGMWVHVPASGGSLPQELPGGGVKGRLPGTQAAWLQEERNRHPKDSKCFQMGKFMSDWGAKGGRLCGGGSIREALKGLGLQRR